MNNGKNFTRIGLKNTGLINKNVLQENFIIFNLSYSPFVKNNEKESHLENS